MDNKTSKLLDLRKEKINELKTDGIKLYPNDFKPDYRVHELKDIIEKNAENLGENGSKFRLAGRMMLLELMGYLLSFYRNRCVGNTTIRGSSNGKKA